MPSKHKSKKAKKHSGRITPRILKPKMKYDDIKIEALEPQCIYDEWLSRKDGMRDKVYLEWKKIDKKKRNKKTIHL